MLDYLQSSLKVAIENTNQLGTLKSFKAPKPETSALQH